MKSAIETYLAHLKLANASENTIRCYRGYLLDFFAVCGESATIDLNTIEAYLAALHKRGLAKSTVRRALASLKSFCRWMVDDGLLDENPVEQFRGPRGNQRIRRRITETQARQLCQGPIRSSFPVRDRLILHLLYGSGLRCEEVAALRKDDYQGGDVLVVLGKGDKQRQVLLTEYAQRLLRIYLWERARILQSRKRHGDTRGITGMFFGLSGVQIDALTPKSIHRLVTGLAKDASLAWVSPHDLRRAFATHMWEREAPIFVISKLLGHKNLSTTQLYIGAASPERLKKAYFKARTR